MKTPLKITSIDNVVLHVKDLSRAKKFYVDLLGMKVAHKSSWQLFLQCGKQGVGLFEVEKRVKLHAGGDINHMAFRLKSGDYQQVKALLEEAGIEVTGRVGDPYCIYFNDPDNHRLQLLTPGEQ